MQLWAGAGSHPGMQRLCLYLAACLFLLTASACKKDDYLRGIDGAALFAPPTSAELAAVEADWASRQLAPNGYRLEQTVPLNGGAELRFISFQTGPHRTQAAVLVPSTPGPHPVQLLLSGFDINNPVYPVTLQTATSTTTPPSPFILGWVAFRGQVLRVTVDGRLYETPRSEGSVGDAFDGATDDAQALLPWARRAVDAALRAAQKKPAAKKNAAPAERSAASSEGRPALTGKRTGVKTKTSVTRKTLTAKKTHASVRKKPVRPSSRRT